MIKNNLEPIGIVFGKTTPSLIQAVLLKDAGNVGIGQLVRIPFQENNTSKDLLGRIVSVWTKNRLLDSENFVPHISKKDILTRNTIENLGIAKDIGGWTACSILIIGYQYNGVFVRPRTPLKPSTIIYRADDEFVSTLFKKERTINIGTLRDNSTVSALVDYEKLVTHHFSVLAMTGAGKSYTVGVILEELFLVDDLKLPILLIDPHSEYSSTAVPNENSEEAERIAKSVIVYVPGDIDHYIERKFEQKYGKRRATFSIKFHPAELETSQIKTLLKQYYGISEAQSVALDKGWDEIHSMALSGDYPKSESELLGIITGNIDHKGTKRALYNKLKALLHRPFFVFEDKGTDLTELIERGQISILDFGGIESFDQQAILGLILRKLFEMRKKQNKKIKPFLTIIEEAHNFIPPRNIPSASRSAIARIAAEGRKFGIGLGIISQRPSKLDPDVLSQCNTHIILRLMNPKDQSFVQSISEYMTAEDFEAIKGLATGEAMVLGYAVPFTILVKVKKRRMMHGGITPSLREELEN